LGIASQTRERFCFRDLSPQRHEFVLLLPFILLPIKNPFVFSTKKKKKRKKNATLTEKKRRSKKGKTSSWNRRRRRLLRRRFPRLSRTCR
jgi:hypothetical protein